MTDSAPLNLVMPDAGARHAGELLRRAREAQGLTLDHLATQIKVSPLKLEALEQAGHELERLAREAGALSSAPLAGEPDSRASPSML